MFFSVDCQLLLTCLLHRVIPFVLNPTQGVMSMIVNHLHQVFSKIYIYTEVLSIDTKKSTMHISYCTTVHHLHQVLRAKDGYMPSLFIEMKIIHQIISVEYSTYYSVCDYQLFRVVTWKHFSQFTLCIVAKMSNLGLSVFCNISNWNGVAEFCSSGFNEWAGVHLNWVHLHSATCQTDTV